ncbi:MAG: 6-phosphogluconolactonase [Thermodesulfobacteriota bacterium]
MEPRRPEIIVCKESLELYSRVAAAFITLANDFQKNNGRFNVALCGGSTPLPLYGLLASLPLRENVKWSKVHFFWSDERCVPPDSEESNYGMAALNLLEKIGALEKNVHRIEGELGEGAASVYERELKRAFGLGDGEFPAFDLMLLGMGVDGHTASLFPGSAALGEEENMVTSEYVEKLGSRRITFTPPIIQKARNIIFLVRGGEKAAVLRALLECPFDPNALPAALTMKAEGRVRWFVDKEAASLLSGGA